MTTSSEKSRKKIAQLHAAIKGSYDVDCFERILRGEGDINQPITSNSTSCFNEFSSLLHSVDDYDNFQLFKLLLNHGVDFTVRDVRNNTVIHKIVQQQYIQSQELYMGVYNEFIDAILKAHVKFQNHTNPRDEHGVSHLHVACMANNHTTVKFFLENEAEVDERVRDDSPIFAGFTPLHFAVKCSCLQTTEILLKYNPNVRMKNAKGLSVLDVLIERKVNEEWWDCKDQDHAILELLAKYDVECNENVDDDTGLTNLHVACLTNDSSVVQSILENLSDTTTVNSPLKASSLIRPGCTPLHFAASSNMNSVKLLIDNGADILAKDSRGITPFDICLDKHSLDDILYLVSIDKQWRDVILSDHKTKLVNVISAMRSDEKFTELLVNFDHQSIAGLTIPMDSPLWPGYTILHLAVLFSEKSSTHDYSNTHKIVECLKRGSSITKTDVNTKSPVHLAFYLQKYRSVEVLLKHDDNNQTYGNPVDINGLSHLHIACAAKVTEAVDRLLKSGYVIDINATLNVDVKWKVLFRSYLDFRPRYTMFAAGSTALHVNVACGNADITRMLLKHGADVHVRDANGLTPVHRLFTSRFKNDHIDDLLLNVDGLRDCRDNDAGFSHLHVAVHFEQYDAIEKLLDSDGVDINAVVSCQRATNEGSFDEERRFVDSYDGSMSFLTYYDGFTPLHFSIESGNDEVQQLLLMRGADVLAGKSSLCVPAWKIFEADEHEHDDIILSVLINDNSLMRRLKERFGVTLLHIACRTNRIELIKDSLKRGDDDVNGKVNANSPIWRGWTPLHLVAKNVAQSFDREEEDNLMKRIQLLLDYGADVKLMNETGESPIQLLSRIYNDSLTNSKFACMLIDSLKNFDVNEAHSQGMSFFHFACVTKSIEVIEGFLKNNIDVNKSVDFFVDRYAGSSPLHLAAGYGSRPFDSDTQLRIVRLLLEHGANVNVTDVFDNTPLHSAAVSMGIRHVLFGMFIKCGIDVNAENIRGETALEILLKSLNATWFDVECLLKHGSRINSFNAITQTGYVARILNNSKMHSKWDALNLDIIKSLLDSDYVNQVDNAGRSILHNIVSIDKVNIKDYARLVELLVKRGCNVNHRDNNGRTALHIATWFRNTQGVLALLRNSADINVTDNNGKTAFSYTFEPPRDRSSYENHSYPHHLIDLFAMHIHKMRICGLYASDIKQRPQADAIGMYHLNNQILGRINDDKEKSKSIKIESTPWTLYELAFEMNLEMIYPSLPLLERLEIDRLFENIRDYKLHELDYLLKLKYESAAERLRLLNLAMNPFITLLNKQLPDLCCQVILSFLVSSDLKNVIALKDL